MGVDFSSSHRAMDARQHEQSYSAFIKIAIAACIVTAVTLAGALVPHSAQAQSIRIVALGARAG